MLYLVYHHPKLVRYCNMTFILLLGGFVTACQREGYIGCIMICGISQWHLANIFNLKGPQGQYLVVCFVDAITNFCKRKLVYLFIFGFYKILSLQIQTLKNQFSSFSTCQTILPSFTSPNFLPKKCVHLFPHMSCILHLCSSLLALFHQVM